MVCLPQEHPWKAASKEALFRRDLALCTFFANCFKYQKFPSSENFAILHSDFLKSCSHAQSVTLGIHNKNTLYYSYSYPIDYEMTTFYEF